MADLSAWSTERLRALDRAVAVAAGWIRPEWADAGLALPEVSLGCRETFELMEEAQIAVRRELGGWLGKCLVDHPAQPKAPLASIAICLAYLAAKGVKFAG